MKLVLIQKEKKLLVTLPSGYSNQKRTKVNSFPFLFTQPLFLSGLTFTLSCFFIKRLQIFFIWFIFMKFVKRTILSLNREL